MEKISPENLGMDNIYQTLFTSAGIGMGFYTPEGIVIDFNDLALRYINKERHEVTGLHISKLFPEKDARKYLNRIEDAIKSPEPIVYEDQVDLSGKKFWFRSTCAKIEDENGRIAGVQVISSDITEKMTTRKKLEKEQRLSRQYLDTASTLMMALDENANVTLINPRGCEITGYSKEEIIGKNWIETCLPKETVSEVKQVFQEIIDGNIKAVEYFENPIIRKDGTKRRIAWHNSVLRDHDDKIIGYFTSGEDISEKKEAEKALQESEEKYKSLIDSIDESIWEVDSEGKSTFHTPQILKILGYSSEEIKGKTPFDFMSKAEANRIRKKFVDADRSYVFDYDFKNGVTNNTYEWCREGIEPQIDNLQKLPLDGIPDWVETHKKGEKFYIPDVQALPKGSLKDILVPQGIKSLITIPLIKNNECLGFADLLADNEFSVEETQNYLSIIRKNGERLVATINDLIDISKIEAGQMSLQISDFSIDEQMDDIHSFFKAEAHRKGVDLMLFKPEVDKTLTVRTDKEKLYSILTNLIKNAIKFTHQGKISMGYYPKRDTLEFYVKDTGIGIAKEKQKGVFDRFVQAETSHSSDYEGCRPWAFNQQSLC